ncbi:MAG: penicillin-binding protein 2 [Flavobacteriales bacterium]|nr:MAG: penicillin-binding protein 2 [Flavobacteriales bacterium]
MNLSSRKFIVGLIFLVVGILFIIRLFNVQILDDKYKSESEDNVLRKEIQYPARGLIYDRKGELLVYNEAAYDLMVLPRQVKEIDTLAFCKLLEIEKEEFLKKFLEAKNYSRYKSSTFLKEISSISYANIQEQLYRYPGFFVQTRTLRKYPRNSAAHILGYIGEVNQKVIDNNSYYKSGDYIGKSGLEYSYEELLRGTRGVKRVLVDVHNREKGSYLDGAKDTMAVTGTILYTTLDIVLQEYGELLMQNKKGSIVAIEPKTGEILSLVSAPNYDPNMLVGRAVKQNYPILSRDTMNPLFNRALMAKYPPGSIFKTVQALVGMQAGVINEEASFPCIKSLVNCHNHPRATSVSSSIKMSCNPYYYSVFKRLIQQKRAKSIYKDSEIGLGIWSKQIKKFGFGVRLATDLPGINSGYVPDVGFYNRWYGEGRWAFSTIYSLSIGQGEVGVIPLQMANLSAIIANQGYYYVPHFIKVIDKVDSIPYQFARKESVGVDKKYFLPIVEGMYRVVNEPGGTARRAKIMESILVCGKTGTAQNPHGEDHSVFIAFAPKENPQIAIAVFVENAGFGGTWAAPIASLMIEQYLTDSISNKNLRKQQRILDANLLNVKVKK